MKKYISALAGLLLPLPLMAAQETTKVAPGTPVTITVTTAAASPPVSITLGSRHGHTTPSRCGFTHTGGGNIDIQQPSSDTVVITMTGVAVAGGHPCKASLATMASELEQCFEITFDNPKVKKAKLTMEGRVIGLLRTHKCGGGSAGISNACASITSNGGSTPLSISVPPHSESCGGNLSMNCHEGPLSIPVMNGTYTLQQTFAISASHPKCLLPCKAASAEFAPDPALDPLWISYWEPFHGAAKKDFGFQVTIKVADDTDSAEPEKKEDKKEEEKKADNKAARN